MDFQQLKYVVEVAKTGSISAAAKNLYMSQPNLSKSIKELETETGIELFVRTAKGAQLTPKGAGFVEYAKPILQQVEHLEELYTEPKNQVVFGLSAPRATYIASLFSRYIGTLENRPDIINYRETNPLSVIHQVSAGDSHLGIVRIGENQEEYFRHMIEEHHFRWEIIQEFQMKVMMNPNHPLAQKAEVTPEELAVCTEIVQGDIAGMFSKESLPADSMHQKLPRQINVYDRRSQFHFLRQIEDSYMWVSPVPEKDLKRHGVILRSCTAKKNYCDIAIYKPHSEFHDIIEDFVCQLQQTVL